MREALKDDGTANDDLQDLAEGQTHRLKLMMDLDPNSAHGIGFPQRGSLRHRGGRGQGGGIIGTRGRGPPPFMYSTARPLDTETPSSRLSNAPPSSSILPKRPLKAVPKAPSKAIPSAGQGTSTSRHHQRSEELRIQRGPAGGGWGQRQLASSNDFMAIVTTTFSGDAASRATAPSQADLVNVTTQSVAAPQESNQADPVAARISSTPSSREIDLLSGPAEDLPAILVATPTGIRRTVTAGKATDAPFSRLDSLHSDSASDTVALPSVPAERNQHVGNLLRLDSAESTTQPSQIISLESEAESGSPLPLTSRPSSRGPLTMQDVRALFGPSIGKDLAVTTVERVQRLIDGDIEAADNRIMPSVQTHITSHFRDTVEATSRERGPPTSASAEQKTLGSTAKQIKTVQDNFAKTVAGGTIDTSKLIIGESLYAAGHRRSGLLVSLPALSAVAPLTRRLTQSTRNSFGPATPSSTNSRSMTHPRHLSTASLSFHSAANNLLKDYVALNQTQAAHRAANTASSAISNDRPQTPPCASTRASSSRTEASPTRGRGALSPRNPRSPSARGHEAPPTRGHGAPGRPALPAHLTGLAPSSDPGAAVREQYGGARNNNLIQNPFGLLPSISAMGVASGRDSSAIRSRGSSPSRVSAVSPIRGHGRERNGLVMPANLVSEADNPGAVAREQYGGARGSGHGQVTHGQPPPTASGSGAGHALSHPGRIRGRSGPALPAHLAAMTRSNDPGAAAREQYGSARSSGVSQVIHGQFPPTVSGSRAGRDRGPPAPLIDSDEEIL